MAESPSVPGYNPQIPQSIAELPANFLDLDPRALHDAATEVRSMEDLVASRDNINASGLAGHLTASGLDTGQETPDDVRHMQRGASLAWDLLRSAASGITRRRPLNSRVDFHTGGREFEDAREALIAAREGWDGADSETVGRVVDAILTQAGLDDAFAIALEGLRGPGLEEPTRPGPARYGAAHAVIGAAIAGAYPAE